jgi:hypothetical protein
MITSLGVEAILRCHSTTAALVFTVTKHEGIFIMTSTQENTRPARPATTGGTQ